MGSRILKKWDSSDLPKVSRGRWRLGRSPTALSAARVDSPVHFVDAPQELGAPTTTTGRSDRIVRYRKNAVSSRRSVP